MTQRSSQMHKQVKSFFSVLGTAALGVLIGCSTPPPAVTTPPPLPAAPPSPVVQVPEPIIPPAGPTSLARSSREYRKDAAGHLYGLHAQRIYKGRMPPLLEAVGVLNVDIDQKGSVKAVHWMRAPKHAPHVMAEIERMVSSSAPYPVPKYMSKVTYTDVWLWHKSGKFQLDTLTEGQD
ncbi:hypothetical protein [Limnohabitans sp.]|jgi:protein TonB|uniref:hypothetical protein n=1 Tax=Limnohabitans sp. TaxID=1907725 RepID=UPI0037BFD420